MIFCENWLTEKQTRKIAWGAFVIDGFSTIQNSTLHLFPSSYSAKIENPSHILYMEY